MTSALAAKWNSAFALDAARQISSVSSLYCGPAAVGWIAAVWNQSKGLHYDFKTRLNDKILFPDGPRLFHGRIPGFQLSLNDLLLRETNGALKISYETYFKSAAIRDALHRFEIPLIVRIKGTTLRDGLHYVTLFNSEIIKKQDGSRQLEFWWQDNGLFGSHSGVCKKVLEYGTLLPWGAKRIVETHPFILGRTSP